MKKFIICLLVICIDFPTYAQEIPQELYARSAVLIDAVSGRVLFEKNANEMHPMASTTKIMTCILALEQGNLEDIVSVSDYAVSQPKVHLGMYPNQEFYLKDLLYSMMLESHNDSTVAVAEHIGGTVQEFAKKMNQKAKDIGCDHTHFVTPNGLDGFDKDGIHATTAIDLATIMRYCIQKSPKSKEFIEITGCANYQFASIDKSQHYLCNNHNAFLTMMEGAFTGKTGFTGDAGYCYVGALRQDGRTYIVALLACGWPNHRNYKWEDTKKLMEYGLRNYQLKRYAMIPLQEKQLEDIIVNNGVSNQYKEKKIKVKIAVENEKKLSQGVLLKEQEQFQVKYHIPKQLDAPVKKGEIVGTIEYLLDGRVWNVRKVIAIEEVKKIDFPWCLKKIIHIFVMNVNIYQ
ncbi:MAG: D-alanyl-D-alanine carboxypeptidase family protein [Lachnospiraceae bacterium]